MAISCRGSGVHGRWVEGGGREKEERRMAWKAERRSWNVKKNGLHRRPHTYRVNRDSGEKDDSKARRERERKDTEADRADVDIRMLKVPPTTAVVSLPCPVRRPSFPNTLLRPIVVSPRLSTATSAI